MIFALRRFSNESKLHSFFSHIKSLQSSMLFSVGSQKAGVLAKFVENGTEEKKNFLCSIKSFVARYFSSCIGNPIMAAF